MKKTNRLIIFALSLAIVISALVGISVSAAEDEGALEIKKINLIYGDKVELLVAVDISNEYRDNVEVTYTFDGETYTAELHPTEVYRDENDATFPVFRTIGIAPKDIGKPMTFEAHIKDSGATGAALSASILDYLYARLYKEGYINKTEDEDIAKKNLYQNTINYASSALEVLVNYKQGKNETLYSDYVFAWGADSISKVASDRYFGAFVPGTEVTPTYAGEFEIKEWNLYDVNGEAAGTLAVDTAYELNAHTKFEAVQKGGEDPVIMDYENGVFSDYVTTYDASGNKITGNYSQATSKLDMGLAADPKNSANHVLQVRNTTTGGDARTDVQISNDLQTGNLYTFGSKIYVAGNTAGNNFAKLRFVTANGEEALNLYLKTANKDAAGTSVSEGFAIATTGTNASIKAGTQIFDAGDFRVQKTTWIDLRVELYYAGGSSVSGDDAIAEARENTFIKVYVNGTLAYSGNAYWAVTSDIKYAEITHVKPGATANISYDDIYFTRTDKEYVSD